ncbi:PLP-dependent aminotransferase family protein [Pseudomonas sp. efr-133-TYG-5]|uniref:MocR-like pyridoxine biosynthesis transcription factor PdxR n=1 Tax=Pseudomonas sp. efr-133-TYG-5 TaxID=3040310 RepID=UPI002552B804|nr:PLP-dependent aminotransferase family protein [Pseudomonas sp. efr-133-TYG-5]
MDQLSTRAKAPQRGAERRIYARLRAQIEDRTLAPGAALLSTRALAVELGVSRTTVTAVYEQLAAEGFITTAKGKTARVADGMNTLPPTLDKPLARHQEPPLSLYGQRVAALQSYSMATPGARIDFRYGAVDSRDFPALDWQRAYRTELLKRPDGEPAAEARLRSALQGYLRRARGLACDVEQIVIVQGSQQGVDLCARLLLDPGDAFVFEDPGYRMARYSFESVGAHALPIAVDEGGLDTGQLPNDERVRLAYVTPSHQFPMGSVLSVTRRLELLEWANEHHAWIIEDDYGGEFRYGQRPIDALRSIDANERVIYAGTVSKALTPRLRLGYLVLPHALVHVFNQAKRLSDRQSPRWEHSVLATLIDSGIYERHVRRLRRANERRRKALIEAIDRHLPGQAQLLGMAAGLHGVLLLPTLRAQAEPALQAAALEQGVGVYPLTPLFAESVPATGERPAALILGYAGLTVEAIEQGIGILAQVIRRYR